MLVVSMRRPLLGSSIALTLIITGWCAACSTPTPVTGDTATRFAAKDVAMPMNYPVALPSNWESYMNPNTAPSAMPAGWPPSNLSGLSMTWPSGFSPNGSITGPVDTSGIGPSSYTGNDLSQLPAAAQSAIPGGINLEGQGPDMISGLFTGDPSMGFISPSASPMMNMNDSQPFNTGGFGFQSSSGWTQ